MVEGPGGPRRAAESDATFRAFADASQPLLRGCALLLVADPLRADRLAEYAVARRHPALEGRTGGGRPADPLLRALQDLLRPPSVAEAPPWSPRERVQLLDAGPRPGTPPLLAELQRLSTEQRASLVLGQYAGLTAAQVAAVLGTDHSTVGEPTVERWVQQAYATLADGRPDRLRPGRLAEELRSATAEHLAQPAAGPATALGHARQLLRRRRTRGAAALLAAVLVLVLGAVTVVRAGDGGEQTDGLLPSAASSTPSALEPDPVPSTPLVRASCDVEVSSCRASVMREWRASVAQVTGEQLDPDGRYFTGYDFYYDPRYETPAFWAGGGGALGLRVTRRDGATEIYVQVATGYDTAVDCGRTTRQRCESMRFMDGNRFSLSTGTTPASGIEVQHRPDGDQVVTVAAIQRGGGRALPVTRGDLMQLAQDPRLRLPVL